MKKSILSALILTAALTTNAYAVVQDKQAGKAMAMPQQQLQLVNINTATEEQLASLPGIGKKKAAAIVAYRNEHGAFKSVDELQNVSGVGKASMKALEGKIGI